MAVMIFKPARTVVVDGVERVVSDYEQWYVSSKDFHSKYGVIKDVKPGSYKLGNEEFFVVPALFVDEYKQMKRKAQIITRKDVGFLIGFCGLTRDSVVVESGAGSGGATILFASVCKHVCGRRRPDASGRPACPRPAARRTNHARATRCRIGPPAAAVRTGRR